MKYPKTVEINTKHLIELVGVVLELMELDTQNREWYEGYRDAIVVLIGDTTGNTVNLVRRELTLKIKEFQLENQVEEMFGNG